MSWSESLSDDELSELARLALDEQAVENIIGMALTGWELADPDAALARLISGADEPLAAGLRAAGTADSLVFKSDVATIDMESTPDGWSAQITPAPSAASIEKLDGSRTLPLDEHGRFRLSKEDTSSPTRFNVTFQSGDVVVSEWFRSG